MAGMVRTMTPGAAVEQVAGYLFDRGRQDAITEELDGWLAGSARFRSFGEVHRDKIRKKVRTAADAEALRDVRTELQAARLLLVDTSIELAFEAYGSGEIGPDLTRPIRLERQLDARIHQKQARGLELGSDVPQRFRVGGRADLLAALVAVTRRERAEPRRARQPASQLLGDGILTAAVEQIASQLLHRCSRSHRPHHASHARQLTPAVPRLYQASQSTDATRGGWSAVSASRGPLRSSWVRRMARAEPDLLDALFELPGVLRLRTPRLSQ